MHFSKPKLEIKKFPPSIEETIFTLKTFIAKVYHSRKESFKFNKFRQIQKPQTSHRSGDMITISSKVFTFHVIQINQL